jgi:DNA-cytosine methyltransferase
MMLKVLDLFSGIGGFSLGLERTGGFETKAFCEIDPFCRRVLAKHWPKVPCYDDIRELTGARLAADGIAVDVICGGFPCQDVSIAGRRAGMDGERSGLWSEYARLVREIRPEYVIVENTPGLLSLGMGVVLGDLAALGFDAEWHCIPVSALGADHIRDRVWIIANDAGGSVNDHRRPEAAQDQVSEDAADPDSSRELQQGWLQSDQWRRPSNGSQAAFDTHRARRARWRQTGKNGAHAGSIGARLRSIVDAAPSLSREHWDHQPVLGRGIHGVSFELDLIGRIDGAESNSSEAVTEVGNSCRSILLAVWEHQALATTSPELYRQRLRNCVPKLSHGNSSSGWLLGAWVKKDQGLRDLWEAFYTAPLQEAEDLQFRLLERARKKKCPDTVGRVSRIAALGNAVHPKIPEMIGLAILQVEAA